MVILKKSNTAIPVRKKPDFDELGILPVSETDTSLKALFYGRSGTGKTTLASTFPRPVLFLACEKQGTLSVKKQKDVHYKEVEVFEDFEKIYWALKQDDGETFKTVVLDTATSWQEKVMGLVNDKGVGETVSQKTWGKCASTMKTWITNLIDLPINVVILAQERTYDPEESDDTTMLIPEVGPYVMPSVAKILEAAVSIIGQTYIRGNIIKEGLGRRRIVSEYCLRVGPHTQYITKIRRDSLSEEGESKHIPSFLINPTYNKILDIVLGNDVDYQKEVIEREASEITSESQESGKSNNSEEE